GMLDAQVALAEMLLNGSGGKRSPEAAIQLFRRAAADGHAGAMFALGALQSSGEGLPVDHVAAQKWFAAAAEHHLRKRPTNFPNWPAEAFIAKVAPASAAPDYCAPGVHSGSGARLWLNCFHHMDLSISQQATSRACAFSKAWVAISSKVICASYGTDTTSS
ncbi:MAG: sel1 repeat family protein, partial [Mesorhizobium sp.]